MELLPNLNIKDKDARYLLENKDDLQFRVIVYFDREPEQLRQTLSMYPDFFRSETITKHYPPPSLWRRYVHKEKQREPRVTISDYLVGEHFDDGQHHTEIVPPSFFTDADPGFLEIFGIYIEGDGKNILDLPLEGRVHFQPKSLLFNDYLLLPQAINMVDFYLEKQYAFEECNLQYLGLASLVGSDNFELEDALERLDNKYKIFNVEDCHVKPFMANTYQESNMQPR